MVPAALPRLRPALAALAAILLVAALAVLTPAAAFAHDRLVESSPAADASVQTLPAELTLTYSAELITGEGATIVEVTGPDGASANAGEPVVEGAIVRVPLTAEAAAGSYQVAWRVVSSDGHPISDEFAFEVLTSTIAEETEPAEEPAEEPLAEPDAEAPAAGEETESPASRVFFSPGVIAALVAGAGFVVVLAFVALRARSRRPDESATEPRTLDAR